MHEMLKGRKVIIFDMDGTLIDSVGIWNEVDEKLIGQIRKDGGKACEEIQETRDRVLREFAAAPAPYIEYCRYLQETYQSTLTPEEIHTLRYEIAQDYLENVIDYKPDADRFLRYLKEKGFHLAIATTTRRKNMEIYRTKNRNIRAKAPIDEYFSPVYCREDAQQIKPHPEIYLRVMQEAGVRPEECLIFEDSLIGLEAAVNAGMPSVAVYDRYSDPDREKINEIADYRIRDYKELLGED